MRRSTYLSVAGVLTVATIFGCKREHWTGGDAPANSPAASSASTQVDLSVSSPAAASGTLPLAAPALGSHPRILLSPARLAVAQANAAKGSPSWQRLQHACAEPSTSVIESGYMGEDWAAAALDLALCANIQKKPALAAQAARYLMALVDDKEKVGDGAGGDKAEEQDDGYAIRNRGFLAAIAMDWLHDTLTPEQRGHLIERFARYFDWYERAGYRKTEPISNHFMGYFGTGAMVGAACGGEDPRCDEIRKATRLTWNNLVVPAYKRLDGGDFPEGWQYARFIGSALGLYIDAESRANPAEAEAMRKELPWLAQSIAFQTQAMLPDFVHMYDNADWSEKPAMPFPMQIWGAAAAYLDSDPIHQKAIFLARAAKRDGDPGWDWLSVPLDDPASPGTDPRTGGKMYIAPGTGTMFARTGWDAAATWMSLTDAVYFGDHQHLDQGHVEMTRGADRLLIDPGDYDAYSTTSHNTILVNDNHENLRWSPNQGIWCKDCRLARTEIGANDSYAYAEAEMTGAYNADGYPEDHPGRSVTLAQRELVFARGQMIVFDRVTVTKPTYDVIAAFHLATKPVITGNVARSVVGGSSLSIATLLPDATSGHLLVEPTEPSDEEWVNNKPAKGIDGLRLEIASPKGANERRFLDVLTAAAASDAPPSLTRIDGDGMVGVLSGTRAYVFSSDAPTDHPTARSRSYKLPNGKIEHLVADLLIGGRYDVQASTDGATCTITVTPGSGSKTASSAGTLSLSTDACVLR